VLRRPKADARFKVVIDAVLSTNVSEDRVNTFIDGGYEQVPRAAIAAPDPNPTTFLASAMFALRASGVTFAGYYGVAGHD